MLLTNRQHGSIIGFMMSFNEKFDTGYKGYGDGFDSGQGSNTMDSCLGGEPTSQPATSESQTTNKRQLGEIYGSHFAAVNSGSIDYSRLVNDAIAMNKAEREQSSNQQ